MFKPLILILAIFNCTTLFATEPTIDLYGDKPETAAKIITEYKQAILVLDKYRQEISALRGNSKKQKKIDELSAKNAALGEKIRRQYGYLFTEISTMFYPDEQRSYITIDVVRAEDKPRMRFIYAVPPPKTIKAEDDLITKTTAFELKSRWLLEHNQLSLRQACPYNHCLIGANDPKLQKAHQEIVQASQGQHGLIIKSLTKDEDPQRRASAAFLVGYFKDPQQIIKLLLPKIYDPDIGVRNNAMRVMALTLYKNKTIKLAAKPFLNLLDSPILTDRNKALAVLLFIANQPENKKLLLAEGRERLLSLLALKQPNNCGIAYFILTTISGKNFAENDLNAWQNWSKQLDKLS